MSDVHNSYCTYVNSLEFLYFLGYLKPKSGLSNYKLFYRYLKEKRKKNVDTTTWTIFNKFGVCDILVSLPLEIRKKLTKHIFKTSNLLPTYGFRLSIRFMGKTQIGFGKKTYTEKRFDHNFYLLMGKNGKWKNSI